MNNNKLVLILIALSAFQSILLFNLIGSVNLLSDEKSDATNIPTEQRASQSVSEFESTSTANLSAQKELITQSQIREIIRQELSGFSNQNQYANNVTTQPKIDYPNNQVSREIVDSEINALKAQGAISQSDIETFNVRIATLAPKERTRALSRLAKAINNGELKVTR